METNNSCKTITISKNNCKKKTPHFQETISLIKSAKIFNHFYDCEFQIMIFTFAFKWCQNDNKFAWRNIIIVQEELFKKVHHPSFACLLIGQFFNLPTREKKTPEEILFWYSFEIWSYAKNAFYLYFIDTGF